MSSESATSIPVTLKLCAAELIGLNAYLSVALSFDFVVFFVVS